MFRPFFDDDEVASAAPGLRAALRIRGDALDPDFITLHLGVAPTVSARRGDRVDDGADVSADAGDVAATGVWSYVLSLPPGTELGDGIDELLARVPNDATLWEELADAYTIDVHCVLALRDERPPQQTSIDAAVLQRLAHLRLPLSLEFAVINPLPR
jgi:hypothetical protein